MRRRFQFVGWIAVCAVLALPCAAQQKSRPPAPQNRPPAPARQERRQERQQARQQAAQPPKANANRPPESAPNRTVNRPPTDPAPTGRGNAAELRRQQNEAARQELGVGAPGQWVQRMRSMPPPQREKFFQSSPAFHNLPPEKQNRIRDQFSQWDRMTPAQRQDQVEKEKNWRSLSPEQKTHIRQDVLPAWKQMSPERQQAISRRLQVLQNMPESARNQRLNDPKFTEGMSEEDKATLRDLSHMHIGGTPDPPSE